MRTPDEESIPALKLGGRRRTIGYLIPLVNGPLLIWEAYEVYTTLSQGKQWNTGLFLNDVLILLVSLALMTIVPRQMPVYTSTYSFTEMGLRISRFLKGSTTIPYDKIARAEVYVKNEKRGEVSKDALKYAKDSADALRKSGFKFDDYTNDDDRVALLICDEKIYLLSPAYPKAFIHKLRKKTGKLPAQMIELTPKGKRTSEF